MYLVQVFLPLFANDGAPLPRELFDEVRQELIERFGGMTGHTRAPAEGLWKESAEKTTRDDIVIFEVMTDQLDTVWWKEYRQDLEQRFRQDQIIVRAQPMELL